MLGGGAHVLDVAAGGDAGGDDVEGEEVEGQGGIGGLRDQLRARRPLVVSKQRWVVLQCLLHDIHVYKIVYICSRTWPSGW